MAVGQFGQFVAAAGQVMGGATLGNHQRQHFTQGQAALGQAQGIAGNAVQAGVDLGEVGAVPDAQAFRHAMHFAMPGHGGQRHAVEVVAHHVLARLQGLRPALIGPHAGGNHLTDFFAAGEGQAVRRVPVLFQLGRQGAAAGGLAADMQDLGNLRQHRLAEARPVHGRVGLGLFRVEQLTVLDEQQAVDYQRWNGFEAGIELLRIVVVVDIAPTAIGDRQPGLDFLLVGHEEAFLAVVQQRRGEAGLGFDQVIAFQQAWEEFAEGAVAQAFVERSVTGIEHRVTGAGLQRVTQVGSETTELARLDL